MPKAVIAPKSKSLKQPSPKAFANGSMISTNKPTNIGAKARETKAPTCSKPIIQIINNQPMTSSLNVAEYFGKQHKNVLQTIKHIDLPEDFTGLNFQPSTYVDLSGKENPCYMMTRDGFIFIIMSFTGKIANLCKMAYINKFNEMEIKCKEALKEPMPGTEITERLYLSDAEWNSVEKECQGAFKEYIKAGGILSHGDDYMKGVYRSIGQLLTMSFRLHTELWTQRKVQLEVQKIVKHY